VACGRPRPRGRRDVSAAADNAHGFAEGQFVAYLTSSYIVGTLDTDRRRVGTMLPMMAEEGAHYADNVPLDGAGAHPVTYVLATPSAQGYYRHADEAPGVAAWWEPFSVSWTFTCSES
jgi:uncharacterized protein involved in high-affinity Fe2+ transport